MSSNSASDKKKSLLLAILFYISILLLLFFVRFWPPSNAAELAISNSGGGVSINFGDSNVGSGDDFKNETLDVKNQAVATPVKAVPDEAILTQENTPAEENSVVIPEKIKPTKPTPVVKEQPKPVPVTKPTISNNTNDALSNLLKGSNKGGDGDDKEAGNKGDLNGNLNSNGYYGNGSGGNGSGNGNGNGGNGNGNGSGGNGGSGYSLGNRKALSKPMPKYTCNEVGKVVVEVSVDKNGVTISAVAGIKGTTNSAKCLLEQAQIAAMNTKWNASEDAPQKQVGKIVYNFNLN